MMKNRLAVTEVERQAYDISCRCRVDGDPTWEKCFCSKEFALHLGYSQPIADVPPGIAVIPLLCDTLPIAWLFDAEIEVDELDEAFFNSIPEFKRGYEAMYPELEFKGTVSVRNVVAHPHATENAALFFSGGIDSTDSLIAHLAEKPALITLWGADVAWENEAGWRSVRRMMEKTAETFGLPRYFVRSNFRKIVKEDFLSKYVSAIKSTFDWWCAFQHGIAMIGQAAPLAFQYGIGRIYVAASCTPAFVGRIPCASVPAIDNFVRFGSAAIVHDGFEVQRQLKTRNICEFANREGIDIPLRVCWLTKDGKNCCACEKCWHTMLGILAEGSDPKRMGFDDYNDAVRKNMIRHMNWEFLEEYSHRFPYIQARLRERYTLKTCPPDLRWFYRRQLDRKMPKPVKLYYKYKKELPRKLRRLAGKALRKIGWKPKARRR